MTAPMHISGGLRRILHRMPTSLSVRFRALPLLALLGALLLSSTLQAQQPSSADGNYATKTPENLQKAEDLLRQGRVEEAAAEIMQELNKNPNSVEAYNLLGFVYDAEKDYENALKAFQNALKIAPNSTKTHNNLGDIYAAHKQYDLAEKEYRTVLRLDPKNRDGNYNLGVLLLGKGASTQAIQYFERVQPKNLATRFYLVQAYFQAKRTAEALQMATKLSAENPNDVQLHFTLGLLLASENQYKPAVFELQKADLLQPGTFEIPYNLGQAYLRQGDYPKAELELNRALKLKPESSDALYLLAQVYSAQSRPLDALDLLVRAHKITPENTNVILLMAQISMSQNYFEDAIPLLESGVQIAPRRIDLRAALGQSYFMAGKVDKAIEEFQKLIEMDPSARSYLYMGLSYRHLGRFDEAKKYFEEGLKLDPKNSQCLFNLGYIAESQGDSARAEELFQASLRSNPDSPDTLLELANLRIAAGKFAEAEVLLKKYVQVSRNPATGYYKLARVERSLHEIAAADRDLKVFQTLSKDATGGPYPYEHLFDYVDTRSKLAPGARDELDITELNDQIKKHPDQPEDLYLLAQAYLKAGRSKDALDTIAQLDKLSSSDYRTQTGIGVLLARYHLYNEAIQHFQTALLANPGSDDVKFNLADAYYRKGQYSEALSAAGQVSEEGRKDNAYLALLGDIYAHMGDTARAKEVFRDAISRNPDNDQDYLSLALVELRENGVAAAKKTLSEGHARIPGSGKILWGLGIVSVLEGNTAEAAAQLERAVDLMPEWTGSYSTLGVFYFETGQVAKAREVLDRFKNSNTSGGLDVNRIEQVLAQAPAGASAANEPMSMEKRQQLLHLALSLADRTL